MPLPPVDHRLEAGESPVIVDAVVRFGRRLPDGVLVLAAAMGVSAATAIFIFWPGLWQLALPVLAVAAFAVWGVADRAIAETAGRAPTAPAAPRLLEILRLVAGTIALAAVVGTIIALLGRTIITTGSGWF